MLAKTKRSDYFAKHEFLPRQILQEVDPSLHIIVVIPCFNETNLLTSLESIYSCHQPSCMVEVIVVINAPVNATQEILLQDQQTTIEANEWIEEHQQDKLKFYLVDVLLPSKHAGVGLARKIGMDEAGRRFDKISNDQGIIVCFDADSKCDTNYLVEIEKHFKKNPATKACSIYFEHPLTGNEHSQEIYNGIAHYELFLRYYIQGLRYANFPYAFHTIGSSMAVRSGIYKSQGGMNRRKAGEDFYFLHKVIPLGGFLEINSTKVIPSPRASDRVPFGTGKAIQKWLDDKEQIYFAYHPQVFSDLKRLLESVMEFYNNDEVMKRIEGMPVSIKEFLLLNNVESKVKEINQHVSSAKMFVNRFYNWFNGFLVLKYVHFARDKYYENSSLESAYKMLLAMQGKNIEEKNLLECLQLARVLDKENLPFRSELVR